MRQPNLHSMYPMSELRVNAPRLTADKHRWEFEKRIPYFSLIFDQTIYTGVFYYCETCKQMKAIYVNVYEVDDEWPIEMKEEIKLGAESAECEKMKK